MPDTLIAVFTVGFFESQTVRHVSLLFKLLPFIYFMNRSRKAIHNLPSALSHYGSELPDVILNLLSVNIILASEQLLGYAVLDLIIAWKRYLFYRP